jgi:hypothetical protein
MKTSTKALIALTFINIGTLTFAPAAYAITENEIKETSSETEPEETTPVETIPVEPPFTPLKLVCTLLPELCIE